MKKAINLSGKMSILGVTKISKDIFEKMREASQNFFVIEELRKEVEENISKKFKSKDCFIVSSASAGIVQTIQSIRRQNELMGIFRKVRVALPVGHHINYGAPIKKIIESAYAEIIPIGNSNKLSKIDLKNSLRNHIDVAFYVSSHYVVNKNHISAKDFSLFYKSKNIITVIDIAAEENVWKFINFKFDFTILSGSKAISGPTSGIIFCSKENKNHLNWTLHNEGRAMKIGKENIVGLDKAVQDYSRERSITSQEKNISKWVKIFSDLKDFKVGISEDVDRKIKRIIFKSTKNKAIQYINLLKEKNIYCREYLKNKGEFKFDLRQVSDDELLEVFNVMKGGIND